jgi:hypothetical protein
MEGEVVYLFVKVCTRVSERDKQLMYVCERVY